MAHGVKLVMIAGIFLVLAAFAHGGRYTIVASTQNATVWVVDRFTGDAYAGGTTFHYPKQ